MLLLSTAPALATSGASDTYVGGGTAVVRTSEPPSLDVEAVWLRMDPHSVLGVGEPLLPDLPDLPDLPVKSPLPAQVPDDPTQVPDQNQVQAAVANPPVGTFLDNGDTVCNKGSSAPSVGGGCVAFGYGNNILVSDAGAGTSVAFQVCIDNDGDGLCTFNPGAGGCADDLYFSHSDDGSFDNPLGPLPTGFRSGCPGGAWPGYVVLLCSGIHSTASKHTHGVTSGTISPVGFGLGNDGDFCGPPPESPQLGKPYLVL